MPERVPFARLGAFYLIYFASLGAFVPYWGLYLDHLGYSAAAIGLLMAIAQGMRIVAPTAWAWVADHTGRHMLWVRVASLMAALIFAGVLVDQSFLWLALVLGAYSFFWTAALPQFEANTLLHLRRQPQDYSLTRLWGSIGFILAVTAVGYMVEARGPAVLPWLSLVLFAAMFFVSLGVPEAGDDGHGHAGQSLGGILRRREVWATLLVAFLMLTAFGPYQVFFTLYLDRLGYAKDVIGLLVAAGVVAEVGVFLLMPRYLPRFGPRLLILVALAATVVRWAATALWADRIEILLPAQLLHMFTFGVFHAVTVYLIHRHFVGRLRGRGQALYSSIGFGAGGALGSLMGGQVWELYGPQATFMCAAAVTAVAFVAAWWGIGTRTVTPIVPTEDGRNGERERYEP